MSRRTYGRAAGDVMQARREMRLAASIAERASWRDRRWFRKQVAAWSEREAEALGRWASYGAPEVLILDGLIVEGENAVKELAKGRERRRGTLESLDLDRTKSRLGDFERDIDDLRDRLDGIEPASLTGNRSRSSDLRVRSGLEQDHGLGHEPRRAISRDVGRGLGR
jgi:hypothetical protein